MARTLKKGRFERRLQPDWNTAKKLWDVARAFFEAHGLDPNESYAMAMTSSELLENALKYGDWDRASTEDVRFVAEVDGRAAIVEVESPVVDDETKLRLLDDRVQWIRGFQSPFEAYVQRLKEISASAYREDESGLGLCRIAYEARCLLDFYVTPTGRLAMSAVYQPSGSIAP